VSALDLTKPVATVAAPARDTAAQYIPAGEDNYREVKEERDALAAELRGAREALAELHALVWGECPGLLNEDSGGNATLDLRVRAALAKEPTT